MLSKKDTLNSGSDLHKSPELIPLKGENPFPLFIDFGFKSNIRQGD